VVKEIDKKYANSGVRLEAFSMRNEVRGGIMTKDGIYRMARERDEEDGDFRQDD